MSSPCVVIVDPYSSGAMLARELIARGASCIAIESSPLLPDAIRSRFDPAMFLRMIRHDQDIKQTLEALNFQTITHVIAATESGVELAEELGQHLRLAVNDPALNGLRRDKYQMAERVRSCGLKTARQFQSSQVDEILEWITNNLDWPAVLKPPKSVSSDHVCCCWNPDEVVRAASAILNNINALGHRNHQVLVQEYLDGTEYVVDTVSLQGNALTTAIWQYGRTSNHGTSIGYDTMTLIPYEGDRQTELQGYTFQVLKALGITNGPAHCEIMWHRSEPVLVEIGARLTAGNNTILSRICGGICQLDETVNTIIRPETFLQTLNQRPKLQKRAAIVFLSPIKQGTLIRTHGLDEIQSLPTFAQLSASCKPGDVLRRVAGVVTLIDEDINAINHDIVTIRSIEQKGIFLVN